VPFLSGTNNVVCRKNAETHKQPMGRSVGCLCVFYTSSRLFHIRSLEISRRSEHPLTVRPSFFRQ